MATATFLVALCCFQVASGVIHTHQYYFTATSGIPNFPEFVVVGVVDGQQFGQYDSFTKRMVPKEWLANEGDSDHWNSETENAAGAEAVFKVDIRDLTSRFNQTEGVHTWQRMFGCQWDDESDAVETFDQYGYDGEDFISLDLKNLRYIASNQQAVLTKNKWDNDRSDLDRWKHYYFQRCVELLKMYVQYGSSALGRTVSPEVTLFQKDSGVVCHSTGFYPDGVVITWKRDGEDLHEDVNMGETLPNEDGTFQKRAELTVSPEERKKGHFTCEVEHRSGKPIVKTLIVEDGKNLVGIIIGCVIVIGVVVAIVIMKKKGYNKASRHINLPKRKTRLSRSTKGYSAVLLVPKCSSSFNRRVVQKKEWKKIILFMLMYFRVTLFLSKGGSCATKWNYMLCNLGSCICLYLISFIIPKMDSFISIIKCKLQQSYLSESFNDAIKQKLTCCSI
ncbi:class I histocompatibility antigen, F10 alpha chain-like isoform X2 [Clupea harengus]|uniref:Class I histocompatibility antigen, F10 alpha chain-like isoform X2 n=1 Tax=Clupea harengus TaxID=7950 RepID=A0A6P8FA30_CLUHA|nr:class I histocompatibility antigen, F10 alpha chain-like isoform X2 [Clupea harengus]